jgi:toxin ParE1/3/4
MKPIVWSVWAIGDRDDIFDYIEAESPRTAALVDSRIEKQVELLGRFPEMGRPGRVEGTRELVVRRTPFLVVYRIDPSAVLVLRVLRGAQEWPDELPSTE